MSLFETLAARWSEDWRVHWEERAAIREYDGGFDRDEAERLAFDEVRRQREARAA